MVKKSQSYEITWLIRRLFRAMSQEADRYLRQWNISAADRAVMEFLYPDLELTVPGIAAKYDVTRQHVQVTVNALLEKGLLRTGENPHHKRSQLVRLSSLGRDCFAELRDKESRILNSLFANIPADQINVTQQTLALLLNRLNPKNPGAARPTHP
jgi:DNA-binding MarR family transcriptional regulator